MSVYHVHLQLVFWLMKPEMSGPETGPTAHKGRGRQFKPFPQRAPFCHPRQSQTLTERACSIHSHRCADFVRSKDVCDRASRDAEKCAAGRSSEEPTDQQGRDVVGKGATKVESEEEAEPDKVDGTAAVEFRERAEHEREEAQAEDEEGQAQGGDFGADVELALDGGVGERDHGRAGRDAERGGGHDHDDGPFPEGGHVERSVGRAA
mgnify:FL=1